MDAYIASDVMRVSTKEKAKKSVYEIEAHCNHRSWRMCAASDQSAHSGLSCLYLPGTPAGVREGTTEAARPSNQLPP